MEITAGQLAALVEGVVEGDGEVKVSGFGKIEEAGRGMVTFLANPKYTHFIYETDASVVLVSNDFEAERPVKATLVRVADPYATLAKLLELVEKSKPRPKGIEQPSYIAETATVGADCYVGAFAYIGEGAKVGDKTLVYPQAYVGRHVSIGADCVIYPGVKIYDGCKIGDRCVIHSGAVIGADGFGFAPSPEGYEKIPQTGIVVIGDDVEIGANTTIDRATFGETRVGRGTKLDNLVQVAHNVEIGRDNVFAAQGGVAGSTKIGNGNRFGGQVGISGHITIGDGNEFGAQSGIPNHVGDRNRLIGYPAIDALKFARMQVYLKRLPELFKK